MQAIKLFILKRSVCFKLSGFQSCDYEKAYFWDVT
jgi:hypothetical protein